jgi:hypothetical protein
MIRPGAGAPGRIPASPSTRQTGAGAPPLDFRRIDTPGADRHHDLVPEPPRAGPAPWKVVVAGAAVLLLAGGWFLLSVWEMGTRAADALGEALGVGFALLVVVSAIGAVLGRDRD